MKSPSGSDGVLLTVHTSFILLGLVCYVELFYTNVFYFVLGQEMSPEEKSVIKDLDKCDFSEIHAMHKARVEARKNLSKEEKQVKRGFCVDLCVFSMVCKPKCSTVGFYGRP